jgi:hypothetical protein
MSRSIAKAQGERQGAKAMGAVGQLLPLARTQWVPVLHGTTPVTNRAERKLPLVRLHTHPSAFQKLLMT